MPTSPKRASALLLLLLGACAHTKAAPRPYPAPAAETLLKALRARQAAVTTVDLQTKTTSWLGGDRIVAKVDMLVDRRGKLRFEADVALQGAVAVLATDGKDFALRDLQEGKLGKGPACAANVASLIRIPLLPREVAAILLGDAPLPVDARVVGVEWDAGNTADVLVLEGPTAAGATGRLRVSLKPVSGGGYDVVAVEGENAGQAGRWRVSYENFSRKGGLSHPQSIRFAEPGKSFDDGVEIKVRERSLNTTFRDEVFILEPGPGERVHPLPCCTGCEVKLKT